MRSICKRPFIHFVLILVLLSVTHLRSAAQDCGPITSTKLKEFLTQMGFAVKNINEAGKADKFEIKNATNGLDIPTSYEISASTNYIWITVFLGKAQSDSSINNNLLRQNAVIQPCFFYFSAKGNLMMGLPVENRAVTTAVLKRCNDFLSNRVGDTKSYWGSKSN